MAAIWTRRSVIRVAALAGASMPFGIARAQAKEGRAIYPVAVAIYQAQFVADRLGFFKEAGLECKLIQGGNGVKTRELVASSQGDIGIGDITHPMQLANRGRKGRVLMPVDTRNNGVVFIIRKDLGDEGISSLQDLAAWKRPDGRKPIIGVSSLGGTNHVWASYYMELLGLDQNVTWVGAGNVDTMLGSLKTKQIDVLVNSPALLRDSIEHGWGKLLFNGSSEDNWNKHIGGKVPATSHFTVQGTIDKDPPKIQAYVTGLWRATQWIKSHSPEEILSQIEPFVGSTSRESNLFEIELMKEITDYDGVIDPAGFDRGTKVWFRELTGIKPLTMPEVVAPEFVDVARKAYPA